MDADWKSFVVSDIISRTLVLALEECGGCQGGNYSPLLHACRTTSLLKKLECFLENPIKPQLLSDLQTVLNQFESRYILMDRSENYIKSGQDFINSLNAQSLYYGRFITKYNDYSICGPCFTPYIELPKYKEPDVNENLEEAALKKQLMAACEDYDNMEDAPGEPPKKKQKTGKTKKSIKNKKLKVCKQIEVLLKKIYYYERL